MVYELLKPGTGSALSIELDYSIHVEDDKPLRTNLTRVPYRCPFFKDFL